MAHTSLASLFSDIADAIRAKTGSSSTIVADNFPSAIAAISTGAQVGTKSATRTDGTHISFTNLSGQPQAFYIYLAESTSTSGVTTDVLCDGANIVGHHAAVSSGKVTFSDTGYSFSYSNGTLTVTTQVYGATFVASKTYYLVYAY